MIRADLSEEPTHDPRGQIAPRWPRTNNEPDPRVAGVGPFEGGVRPHHLSSRITVK